MTSDPIVRDFPTQTALVEAMQSGQRWKGIRTAPADGHPDIVVEGGLRVQTSTPVRGNPGAFSVEVGPLVAAGTRDGSVVVTDAYPGEDYAAAMDRVVTVAAAQLEAGGALEAVAAATDQLATLRQAVAEAEKKWRATIWAATQEPDVRVVEIAAAAGISRERVYQIRDDRR
jgi:hypothetical protein